ncbi:uncharacterized protein LOC107043980 [Diachasma alloeum]|uniref:uncharacterized protein LOC107043980 n=1 Tax=Diachasma alloeum TaxID=454923 RepID=UPI0007381001|nr:uncharacterized protein LOC107043980 [Diachasma alloeum]
MDLEGDGPFITIYGLLWPFITIFIICILIIHLLTKKINKKIILKLAVILLIPQYINAVDDPNLGHSNLHVMGGMEDEKWDWKGVVIDNQNGQVLYRDTYDPQKQQELQLRFDEDDLGPHFKTVTNDKLYINEKPPILEWFKDPTKKSLIRDYLRFLFIDNSDLPERCLQKYTRPAKDPTAFNNTQDKTTVISALLQPDIILMYGKMSYNKKTQTDTCIITAPVHALNIPRMNVWQWWKKKCYNLLELTDKMYIKMILLYDRLTMSYCVETVYPTNLNERKPEPKANSMLLD